MRVQLCAGSKVGAFLLILVRISIPDYVLAVRSPKPPTGQGSFILYKLEKPIGEEKYDLLSDGDHVVLRSAVEITDRGMKEALKATLKMSADLTPEQFEIAGNTSRLSQIDYAVTTSGGFATVRRRNVTDTAETPKQFFTIAGHAPVAVQMMLVRYAKRHSLQDGIRTFPDGRVTVEAVGRDELRVAERVVTLTHYLLSGVVWGSESLWLDDNDQLAACVTVDSENDHFEALRKEYEDHLGYFVARAASCALARLKEQVAPAVLVPRGTTAIVGCALVDVSGGHLLQDYTVLIKKERIVAVGPRDKVSVPRGARVIDASGKFLMPGLWDMHAHFEQAEWGPAYLAAGVTSSRDVGNEFEFITTIKNGLDSGAFRVGPRLLLAGIVDGSSATSFGIIRADTAEQARQVVQRYKRAGFEQIKIYGSVKPDVLRVLAEEAHKCGMTVTGHVPDGMNTYQAVEAGLDQINHIGYPLFAMLPDYSNFKRGSRIPRVDLESAQAKTFLTFLKKHGTVIDPTLALGEIMTHSNDVPVSSFEPGAAKVPSALASTLSGTGVPPNQAAIYSRPLFEDFLAVVGALHKAGITIVAGTDQAVPGHSLHRELELYVQAGFTPLEALQSATIVPARVAKRDGSLGSVEMGKVADLVLLDANPLESISNTRRIRYVVIDGTVFDSAKLWLSAGFKQ